MYGELFYSFQMFDTQTNDKKAITTHNNIT